MSHTTSSPKVASPIADFLDSIVLAAGKIFAWTYVVLMAVIITQVVLRYGFNHGLVLLEELQWHLYAVGVMFGISYAQVTNSHIRVDILHMRFSRRAQHIWEILGILLLMMPFIYVVFDGSLPFVYDSWRINESSASPTGLPYRWLIKSVIPISFGLLFIAALARLIREITGLVKGE